MSFTEWSGTLPLNLNAVQPDPSAKIDTCTESPQESSALTEEMDKRTTSGGDSDLVSDLDSDSESCSDSDSQFESVSGSEDFLRESPALPSGSIIYESKGSDFSGGDISTGTRT